MIGDRLSEIRKDHGDTQSTLADKLSVSLFTIRAWEQGKSEPSHEMLVNICRLYAISSDYLLGLSDIDPVYTQKHRSSVFTHDELQKLSEFEEFLLWNRKKTPTNRK